MKLLLLTTHPIQYQVPWFRVLSTRKEVELKVAYALLPTPEQQAVGFGEAFAWDQPLLDGYSWLTLQRANAQPSLARFMGLRARGLGALLRREAPDAVLLTGWNSLVLVQGFLSARLARIPILLRGDSNDLRRRPLPVRFAHRRLLAGVAAFLAVGERNRAFYRAAGVPPERLFAAPHFVDNDRFVRQAAELAPRRAELRRELGVPEGALCVLLAGKLIPKKRPGDLLDAFERLRDEPRFHLLVVGDGELRQELERRAAAGRLPVSFAGFLNQSEIARAYVAADLLVLPSDAGETWGLVVNEAMACGRPAIVSDLVGCGPDLIVEGETGWRFPCGDVEALAAALAHAASDPERLERMGAAARALVLADYSVDRAVAGTLAACDHVLRAKRER